ncbi:MAG: DUF2177 family protein [Clostridiales bacterium]|nr:DUF2177 family protein [Clostridiales bacterium]
MLKRFAVAAAVFLVIDIVWLTVISPKLYKAHIGHLMADKPTLPAAGVFYVIYIAALLFFVINPAIDKRSVWQALWTGAFLGLAMYATYDLTNQATMKDWPVTITLIDLAWGTFITAATSAITTRIFM